MAYLGHIGLSGQFLDLSLIWLLLYIGGSFKGRPRVPIKGVQVPFGLVEGRFRADMVGHRDYMAVSIH